MRFFSFDIGSNLELKWYKTNQHPMRKLYKRFCFFFSITVILFDIYILYKFLVEEEYSNNNFNQQQENEGSFKQKNDNEFLVLDWTGNRHIFKEHDPIKCDFSHITPTYCQSKFLNDTLRLHLIERCSRLSTLIIRWTADQSHLNQADLIAYHALHMPGNNLPKLIRNNETQQFSTVYVLESEVNSFNGRYWHEIDFPMWYNLERSYPEPITYFDLSIYLNQLFSPVIITFSKKKTTASIVWIASNCHAYNGRDVFIKQLMSYIRIDSYGKCLNNIKSDGIKSNTIIYSSYKFVIAIENSNCEDYVSEKLIHALSSTSIPIIASRNGKPDYARFAPKYSYINIYDYKSIKDLVDYLNYLSINETAYNEYLWFRQLSANNYTSLNIFKQSLSQYLHMADEILGENSTMRKWLLTKERNINKYCKLAEYIYTNSWELIYQKKKIDRPTADEVCLPENDLISYFSISSIGIKKRLILY